MAASGSWRLVQPINLTDKRPGLPLTCACAKCLGLCCLREDRLKESIQRSCSHSLHLSHHRKVPSDSCSMCVLPSRMTQGWGEGGQKKHVLVLLGARLSMATANFGEMRGSTLPSGIFKLVKSSVGPEPATTNYSIGYSGTSVKEPPNLRRSNNAPGCCLHQMHLARGSCTTSIASMATCLLVMLTCRTNPCFNARLRLSGAGALDPRQFSSMALLHFTSLS